MTARSTFALLVPALVAGGLALPAAGALSTAPPARATGLAAGVPAVAFSSGGERVDLTTVQGALTSVRRHDDTRAWLTSIARAVQAAQGRAGAPAPLLAVATEEPVPEPGPVEVLSDFAFAGSGGDLDGDGLADVLSALGDEEDLTLQARRGTDGALLWSIGLADGDGALAYPLGVDVTGDGADDLLSHVVTGSGETRSSDGATESRYDYSESFTHSVAVHSGADGRRLWERQIEGSIHESAVSRQDPAGLTYDGEYSLQAKSLGVLPLLTADVTGDGLDDIVLNDIDLDVANSGEGADAFLAGARSSRSRLRSSTRVTVLAGRDGTAGLRREALDQSGVALAVPAGQLVGSAAGDLLWSTQLVPDTDSRCVQAVLVHCLEQPGGRSGVDAELVDGATGQVAWAVSTGGLYGFATPVDADLDRDGTPDVALRVGDAEGGRLVALSGREGRSLWQVAGADPFLLGVGPDAGGRLVVAVAELTEGYADDPLAGSTVTAGTSLQRRDAATGELLSTQEQQASATLAEDSPFVGGAASWVLSPAPDADGDGRQELVLAVTVEAEGFDHGGRRTSSDAGSSSRVADLADGHVVREEVSDDVRLLLPADDLDGDRLLDLEREVFEQRPSFDGGWSSTVTALRAVDGVELWDRPGGLFASVHPAGDQDGRPGVELVQVTATGVREPQVASLRGADLQERWRAPARERSAGP